MGNKKYEMQNKKFEMGKSKWENEIGNMKYEN